MPKFSSNGWSEVSNTAQKTFRFEIDGIASAYWAVGSTEPASTEDATTIFKGERELVRVGVGEALYVRPRETMPPNHEFMVRKQVRGSLGVDVVETVFEDAVRNRRAFLGSTTNRTVAAGSILAIIIENPSNSTRDLHLVNRLFSNNRQQNDSPLQYQAYINPTVTLSNTSVASLTIGQAAGFGFTTWEVGNITMDGAQASGEVLPNGIPYNRPLEVIMNPGTRLAFTVAGAGGGLIAEAIVGITLEWYETDR